MSVLFLVGSLKYMVKKFKTITTTNILYDIYECWLNAEKIYKDPVLVYWSTATIPSQSAHVIRLVLNMCSIATE